MNLSVFTPVKGHPALYQAVNGNLRAFAFKLNDGNVCVFNPVKGIGDDVAEQLEQLGPVKYLLTPNHYHNKALAEYAARFPKAKLCASDAAIPRLKKLTGLRFTKSALVEKRFVKTMHLHQTQGLKTGEVWLSVQAKDEYLWIVGDAFGSSKPAHNKPSTQPTLLKTFPAYGVADAVAYNSWSQQLIVSENPTIVMPCHGVVFASKRLPERLISLQNKFFDS